MKKSKEKPKNWRLGSITLKVQASPRYHPQRVVVYPDAEILGINGYGKTLVLAIKYPERNFDLSQPAPKETDIAFVERYFVTLFDGDFIDPEDLYLGSAPLDNGRAVHIVEINRK